MRPEVAFPKLEKPVVVPAGLTYAARATLDEAQAREAVRHAVHGGLLRPFDIATADIEEPRLMWIPFWRMAVSIDGFFIDVSDVNVGKNEGPIPIPTGGSRYRDVSVMICARGAFPYAAKLPSLLERVKGIAPIEMTDAELEPCSLDEEVAENAELVDADIGRARAEELLTGLLLDKISPTHVLYPTYEPKLNDVKFCLYPLYYARYTYSGEARRRPGEELFVAISARTGQVVAATYPSAVRSVAAKVRRLLSFDFR